VPWPVSYHELIGRTAVFAGCAGGVPAGSTHPCSRDQSPSKLAYLFEQNKNTILSLFNMFSGGALERMSILALGIMPYIFSVDHRAVDVKRCAFT
jgi:hypothetical protein